MTDKTRYETNNSLSDEAIDRIVQLGSGRATAQDHAQFADWRRQSTDHELAAREAEALWQSIGTAGKKIRKAEKQKQLTRRTVLGLAGFLAGSAALHQSGSLGPRLYADYTTGIGEQRLVTLSDGSTVFLNAYSALSVDITNQERCLTLHEGQALFTVAKDKTRPFIVTAQNGQTRALGTVFDIDIRPQQVVVTVLEGTVGVTADKTRTASDMVVMQANNRISYQNSAFTSRTEQVDSELETAWRRGKLIFDGKPLGEVIAELERYRSGKIVIATQRLQTLRVTGVFDLTQPEEILQSIETTLPVSVTRLPFVTILR